MPESAHGRLDVFAAVVMPDHVHLLVATTHGNLVDHVSAVKSAPTRVWWKHGGRGVLWQRSFHDEGNRSASIFAQALEYVVGNPVEAGLVARWTDYPLIAGSMIETES